VFPIRPPEQPTRRGFLAACSAAAAALGLTARAAPARPPISGGLTPDDLKVIGAAKAELKQVGITVIHGGSGYTNIPVVVLDGGSGATAKAWVATS
jgi:hypothetical protein